MNWNLIIVVVLREIINDLITQLTAIWLPRYYSWTLAKACLSLLCYWHWHASLLLSLQVLVEISWSLPHYDLYEPQKVPYCISFTFNLRQIYSKTNLFISHFVVFVIQFGTPSEMTTLSLNHLDISIRSKFQRIVTSGSSINDTRALHFVVNFCSILERNL